MANLYLSFLKVEIAELKGIRKDFFAILLRAFISIVLIPALFYVLTLNLPKEVRIGVFLLAAANSGSTAPLLADLLGFSVVRTGVFVILTSMGIVFSVPFLLSFFFSTTVELDKVDMSLFLFRVVVVPSALGILCKKYIGDQFAKKVSSVSPWMGPLNLAFLMAAIVADKKPTIEENLLSSITLYGLIGVFSVNLVRFLVGYFLGRGFKKKWEDGLMFVITNNGIMVLLALQFFSSKEVWVIMLSYIPWILSYPTVRYLYLKRTSS